MDVERLGACIPGCERVQALDESTFKTRIKVRVGPFSTTQDVTIRLTELEAPSRLASEGQGDDPRMGSKISLKTTLDLHPVGESATRVDYVIDLKVLGRLGMLGDAVMKRKARESSGEFAENVRSAIEGGE